MDLENARISPPQIPSGRYAQFRLLSLDVMAGAIVCGGMVRGILSIEMHWSWYIVLPLAVWLIYTLDHLLDARRLGATAHTPRHLFHHQYFLPLAIAVASLSLVCLGLALAFLGWNGILFGLSMGGLVILHLLLVKVVGNSIAPWLIKEMGVALVYAVGIWGLPIIESKQWDEPWVILAFLQFLLLVLANLLEFSWYERDTDTLDGHTSFVRAIGVKGAKRLLYLLLGAVVLFGSLLLWQLPQSPIIWLESIYCLMLLVLLALLHFPGYFAKYERYRAWGDGAFLLPVIYLIMEWLQ